LLRELFPLLSGAYGGHGRICHARAAPAQDADRAAAAGSRHARSVRYACAAGDRAGGLATDDPRVAFRRAAIENAVAALYLETIAECGVENTGEMLRAHTEIWRALRDYLRLKYDDAVADDWFDHFTRVARPYIREKVRLTREFALHLDEGAERYARIYDELLRELVQEALAAPQKKSFVPPDFSHS
jgi:hypothetical protein